MPSERRKFPPTIHEATDDGACLGVRELDHGRGEPRRRPRERVLALKRMRAFEHAPAVVGALADELDGFPTIVAIVGRPEVAAGAEGEPPRIAQAVGPDFRTHVGLSDEGIVGGHGIIFPCGGALDVEAEHATGNHIHSLPHVARIAG